MGGLGGGSGGGGFCVFYAVRDGGGRGGEGVGVAGDGREREEHAQFLIP